jgi:hypothetical protein
MAPRIKLGAAALLAALAAGCDAPPSSPPPGNNSAASSGRDYVRAVAALSPRQRYGVFYRAIGAAGLSCPGVTGAVLLENTGRTARWRAHCSDDTDYLVDIAPDGNAVVTNRRTE